MCAVCLFNGLKQAGWCPVTRSTSVLSLFTVLFNVCVQVYRGADKSLARPDRKQATVTEEFDVHISYL